MSAPSRTGFNVERKERGIFPKLPQKNGCRKFLKKRSTLAQPLNYFGRLCAVRLGALNA